jgi:AcrR family transcriptional regulator
MLAVAVLSRASETSEARRAEARSRLLRAVKSLLDSGNAYADLTIEQITSEAGVSRTAFYEHFRHKRQLLMELAAGFAEPLVATTRTMSRPGPADPEGLRSFIASTLTLLRQHAALFRAIVEAATYDRVIGGFWAQLRKQFVDLVTERIAQGLDPGSDLVREPRAMATAMVVMIIQSGYDQVSAETEISDEVLVDTLAAVWMRSIYGATA